MAAKTKTPKPTPVMERDILSAVLQLLAVYGIRADRKNTGAMPNAAGRLVRFGKKGDPDISGTLPNGLRLDIEVKRVGKRPTATQVDRIAELQRAGGIAFWIDDARSCDHVIRRVLAGWRPVIYPNGDQEVWSPDEFEKPTAETPAHAPHEDAARPDPEAPEGTGPAAPGDRGVAVHRPGPRRPGGRR